MLKRRAAHPDIQKRAPGHILVGLRNEKALRPQYDRGHISIPDPPNGLQSSGFGPEEETAKLPDRGIHESASGGNCCGRVGSRDFRWI